MRTRCSSIVYCLNCHYFLNACCTLENHYLLTDFYLAFTGMSSTVHLMFRSTIFHRFRKKRAQIVISCFPSPIRKKSVVCATAFFTRTLTIANEGFSNVRCRLCNRKSDWRMHKSNKRIRPENAIITHTHARTHTHSTRELKEIVVNSQIRWCRSRPCLRMQKD